MIIETDAEELPSTSIVLGKQFRSVQPAAILMQFPCGRSDETMVGIRLWAHNLSTLKLFAQRLLADIEKIQAENK